MLEKLKESILEKKKDIKNELPVILTSIFLLLTLWLFFGSYNIILAAFITVYFKMIYKETFQIKKILKTYIVMLLMSLFSFLAGLNLGFSILVNLIVPFVLVYFSMDKFTPRVYYIYGMGFTFMQLLSINIEELKIRLMALTYAFFIVGIFTFFYNRCIVKRNNIIFLKEKLRDVSKGLKKYVLLKEYGREKRILNKNIKELAQIIYTSRNYKYLTTEYGKVLYNLMIFMKKIIYFLEKDKISTFSTKKEEKILELGEILDFLTLDLKKENLFLVREKIKKYILTTEENIELKRLAELLGRIVEELLKSPKDRYLKEWRVPNLSQKADKVEKIFRIDLFHNRFAIRLSVVLTMTFALTHFIPLQKSYWYPMSAFLMLMPYVEESKEKINLRILGTFGGIVLAGGLMYISGSIFYKILVVITMTFLMYTAPVTSWTMVMYATCYGLTLTTISFNLEDALFLRGLYVVLAVITVYLANKYIFPNTIENEFKKTIKEFFEVERMMIIEIRKSLKDRIEINNFRDLLLKYNLLVIEIENYSEKKSSRRYYSKLLEISYNIVVELEEMRELLTQKKVMIIDKNYLNDILKLCEANIKKSYFLYKRKKELEWENIEELDFERIAKNEYFNSLIANFVENIYSLERLHKKYFE